MGRIRTIKPEFFRHAGLFDGEQETGLPLRVAFAGLWTECDREGRFKWQPRELGVAILPYDKVDFSRVLDALATRGQIARYEVGSRVYGFIPSWREHQVVNGKERKSEIPAPDKNAIENSEKHYASLTRDPRDNNASVSRAPRVPGGKERKGKGGVSSPPTESLQPRASLNGGGGDFEALAGDLTTWFLCKRDGLFPNTAELPAPELSIRTVIATWLEEGLPPATLKAVLADQMAAAAGKGRRPPASPKAYELSLQDALARHKDAHAASGGPSDEDIAAARAVEDAKLAKIHERALLEQKHRDAQTALVKATRRHAPEEERRELMEFRDELAERLAAMEREGADA